MAQDIIPCLARLLWFRFRTPHSAEDLDVDIPECEETCIANQNSISSNVRLSIWYKQDYLISCQVLPSSSPLPAASTSVPTTSNLPTITLRPTVIEDFPASPEGHHV